MTSTIECDTHGSSSTTVVCCHMIAMMEPVGFVENSSVPDDLQAWCHGCEAVFLQEGGMTDVFREFNGMAIVCIDCYGSLKQRHSVVHIQ